jgi:ABC-type glycerol-3-phosphate transport system substrate-binding protein
MKRVLILTAALGILTSGLFAGGSAARSSGPANEITLRMVNRVNADVAIENNQMLRYIREKFGFNIQLEAPPINNYNERLQLLMASGDHPDLVYIWSLDQNYVQWAEQGLLHPVDDLIKTYPNIMRNITADQVHAASTPSTGKAFGVPRTNKVNRWGFTANVRWFNKLGVKAPTTLDELYEVGKLVRDNDPNGTGQADTFLVSPDGDVFMGGTSGTAIMEAFIPNNGALDYADGVYKVRERMSGYYPYLDFMRKLYAEKILDPEYIVNRTYGGLEKVLAGRVAMVGSHDSVVPQDSVQNNNGAFDFLDFFPPIKGTDGIARNYIAPPVWGVWGLPTSSRKTQDALRFLDWGNSPEGYEILYNGVPGVTYNSYSLKARTIDQTPAQRSLWNTVTSSYMTVSFAYEGIFPYCSNDNSINEHYNRSLESYLSFVKEIEIPSVKNPEMDRFNAANPDLITRRSQLENQYVTGAVTRAELENFINTQWLPRISAAETAYQRIMAARN